MRIKRQALKIAPILVFLTVCVSACALSSPRPLYRPLPIVQHRTTTVSVGQDLLKEHSCPSPDQDIVWGDGYLNHGVCYKMNELLNAQIRKIKALQPATQATPAPVIGTR